MSATARVASSKRAKLWRRTWVGASIALGLALVLWIASLFASVWPIVVGGGLLLAACLWELEHMGTLSGRRFGLVLALPSLLVLPMVALNDLDAEHWYLGLRSQAFVESAFAIALIVVITSLSFALVRGTSSMRVGAAAYVATLVLASELGDSPFFPWVMLTLYFFVLVLLMRSPQLRADFGVSLLLALWLIVPCAGLAVVWNRFNHVGLVALIVLRKIGDTAAYYVGNAIGRHHPFKTISPGKTTEGCIASLIAATACGALLVATRVLPSEPFGWLGGCAAGALVNIAAQAGDLLESWFKRRVGVKDSGTWFGPSGGALDLADSVLLGLPVALVTWPMLFTFTS